MARSEVAASALAHHFAPRPLLGAGAALLAVGLLYAQPPLPLAALVVFAIAATAAVEPAGTLLAIPAALGILYLPVRFNRLEFNPDEVLLVASCLGIGLRAALEVITGRAAAVRRFLPRAWSLARTGFGPIALALLAVGTFSLFTVADPSYRHESIREYRWVILEPVVFAFLARWYWRDGGARVLAAISYAGSAGVASAYALVALLLGSGLVVEGVVRIGGTYPHPNALALYLERPFVFAAALAVCYHKRFRVAWLVTAGIIGIALLMTFSRGALMGAGIALVLVVWLGQRHRLAAALVGAGAVMSGVLALVAGDRLLNLFSGGSGTLRLAIWRSSLAMIRDHPIFGVGLDQFLYQYAPRYISPVDWMERFTSHPHDIILDVWLRLGIMGLVVAAAYAVMLVRAGRRITASQSRIGLAALGALVAGALHGLVDNGYFLPDLALAFWLLTTLIDLEVVAGTSGMPEGR